MNRQQKGVHDKMFNETVCLENLKHIVSESADDQHIKTLSLDELRSTYAKITDNIYRISVFNCHTYKNMLWNLDNLKPEIRSKFQKELFDTWHSVYLKTMKTDMPAERPEVEAKEQAPDTVTHPPMESQKEKKAVSDKDADPDHGKKPAKKHASITVSKTPAPVYKEDWFDKLLDFFAAITGFVSGVMSR